MGDQYAITGSIRAVLVKMGDQYECLTGSTRCSTLVKMGDQYEYIQRSHITDLSERPITSLQTVLQVSGDPIPPFLLRLPRDRSPPIERLYGGGRGPAMTGVGKRGALICLLEPRSPLLQLTLRHPSTCVYP